MLKLAVKISWLITLLALFIGSVCIFPIKADGGVGISGSFYRQDFRLLPGETFSSPDVYIILYNNSKDTVRLNLTTFTPPNVTLTLSQNQIVLQPGEQNKVNLTLQVGNGAIPGSYTVSVVAAVAPINSTGVAVTGGVEQDANLTIMGEAGNLHLVVKTVDGNPLVSEIHIYRKQNTQLNPAAFSANGEISTRLAPGDYTVRVIFQGTEVASSDFSIAANENKEIKLTAHTIQVTGFSTAPYYSNDTNKLTFINVVYNLKNIYIPFKNAQIVLKVSTDKGPLEEIVIATMPALDVGNMGGTYKYIPTNGWQNTNYHFELVINGVDNPELPFATSVLQNVAPTAVNPTATISGAPTTTTPATGATAANWMLYGIILVLVLAIIIILILVFRKRRR